MRQVKHAYLFVIIIDVIIKGNLAQDTPIANQTIFDTDLSHLVVDQKTGMVSHSL